MSVEPKHVLVVDDEASIREIVKGYLEGEGMRVDAYGTVAGALEAIERGTPDMVILDVGLPDGSGLDILRRTSTAGQAIPTIVLSARGDETDRIVGLELGADDYVTKPFSPRELTARVRALFRRLEDRTPANARQRPSKVTRVGDLTIDEDFHQVRVGDRPVNVTATEFRILALLAENPGGVFTRSHLLDRLNDGGEIFERTLDRHINNLRKKIEVDPAKPEYVITVYGVGYKMRSIER